MLAQLRLEERKELSSNDLLKWKKNVITEVNKVLNDYSSGNDIYEGLIYIMYRFSNNNIIPLYIGKSEKYGRYSGKLSENIRNIENNRYKFCRWGYGYDYHIGDLSAVLCKGHQDDKIRNKYKKWADSLFVDYTSSSPKLKHPVYFWIRAWKRGEVGIWENFGSTSLTFLEYLLIGVASDLFPEYLLNEEGVNSSLQQLLIRI